MTSPVAGWTRSRYFGYIRGNLRRAFARYPNKYKALAASKEGRNKYRCAKCNGVFPNKQVAVDHIIPCGSLRSFHDLPRFVNNLFTDIKGLQILCKKCHDRKTLEDKGYTAKDIKVLAFRKLKAKGQRDKLHSLGVKEVGCNALKRIKQYEEMV